MRLASNAEQVKVIEQNARLALEDLAARSAINRLRYETIQKR
jgi:hypothetical protein